MYTNTLLIRPSSHGITCSVYFSSRVYSLAEIFKSFMTLKFQSCTVNVLDNYTCTCTILLWLLRDSFQIEDKLTVNIACIFKFYVWIVTPTNYGMDIFFIASF